MRSSVTRLVAIVLVAVLRDRLSNERDENAAVRVLWDLVLDLVLSVPTTAMVGLLWLHSGVRTQSALIAPVATARELR